MIRMGSLFCSSEVISDEGAEMIVLGEGRGAVGANGWAEVTGDCVGGLGELSSARTTVAGVPRVI
jgi:hypothetical protein